MSSLLLSATVRRLLLDRIEATIYSWTMSGDSKKSAMHVHVAALPYLDVTKISIWQPCLNFAVYSSHMLPRRLRRLDVLLVKILTSTKNSVQCYQTDYSSDFSGWARDFCVYPLI